MQLCPHCSFVVGGVLCEHVVCDVCRRVTDITRYDIARFALADTGAPPVIHENGGGHHIGELCSNGEYE